MQDATQLTVLKDFFGTTWNTNAIDQRAIAEIRQMGAKRILDAGCGNNLYKEFFPELFGIDIVNPRADRVCDILEFTPENRFDIILCFGSLNFGSRQDTLVRLQKVREFLTEDGVIFMKVNPGIRWPQRPELEIYPWTPDEIHSLGAESGLMVQGEIRQEKTANGLRYKFKYCCIKND